MTPKICQGITLIMKNRAKIRSNKNGRTKQQQQQQQHLFKDDKKFSKS